MSRLTIFFQVLACFPTYISRLVGVTYEQSSNTQFFNADTRSNITETYHFENPKFNRMNHFLENEQDYLAAKFHINDSHIAQASHLAYLKIQSWKFALRTPTISKRYRQEAQELINKSFCSFVPASYVLSEEGYFFAPLN